MTKWTVLLVLAVSGLAAQPGVAEHEKSIAGLPAEQRVYERYRRWSTTEGKGGSLEQYEQVLRGRGFADAADQVRVVKTAGARAEIARWNRILTSEKPGFNTQPNAFLVEITQGRKPGRALDVGMGQGRNALWLASAGWDVTGFDPAGEAVALAKRSAEKLKLRLTAEVKTREEFDFGEKQWDLILLSYAGGREVPEQILRGLKPGGVLVIESFHADAAKGSSIGRGVVFETGELVRIYDKLRVVRYEEPLTAADFGRRGATVRVVRYCGERVE